MKINDRNAYNDETSEFLQNFVNDLKKLFETYEIQKIHGRDDGVVVLTLLDGTEHDINVDERIQ